MGARVFSPIDQQIEIWLDQELKFLLHNWETLVNFEPILVVFLHECDVNGIPDLYPILFVELPVVVVNGGWNVLWQDETEVNRVRSWLKELVSLEIVTGSIVIDYLFDEESLCFFVIWVLGVLVKGFLVTFHFKSNAAHLDLLFDCEVNHTKNELTWQVELFLDVNRNHVL